MTVSSWTGARSFAVAVVTSLGTAICAPACGFTDHEACTPENTGFGDATRLEQRLLVEAERDGACRQRLEVIRDSVVLRRELNELFTDDVPAIDWSRESIILREAPHARGVQWLVARGDVVTVGLQACAGAVEGATGCRVEIYSVTNVTSRVEEFECKSIACQQPTGIEGG